MAIIKNGIHGGFSGKIGKVVGYESKGQAIMRTQGVRTTPPTPKELMNRQKFAVSQKWLSPLTDFLRIGFKDYQPTYEGFVAAKSYNHKNALKSDGNNNFFIDPALVLVSYGTQSLPSTASAFCTPEKEIVFTWSKDGDCEYNDYAMVLIYNIEDGRTQHHPAITTRRTGTATFKLENVFFGKSVNVYLAFTSDDRKQRSNSLYLGKVAIPI
ncbi:hypothetical protein EZ428_14260 [Pedobacter frigiditerrae]|uniref:Uncharacterized protein n=1 Tax=Pedobacter frigiditerrae TaxID=2530452 RepID=A0A4R0MWV7_9SPHI|nr:DUF6266 family protein [Pedobacter frigiditerrae]TCC90434.1 hypothetical protein EZ428_14260 [Pedobacter frigiditerrae]